MCIPTGPYRPEQGVQRGSVMDMPIYPGDPLTPGWAVGGRGAQARTSGVEDDPEDSGAADLVRRCAAAARNLKGPVAPEAWRGALPITYHIGAGPAKVHLKLAFDWSVRPLYNVIARIDGSEFPDQWIIHGNHHDAWVNGASDPTSGNVVLMETARGLGELLKSGWKPKRTIILASWDGEEWGLLGSTEWVEKHADELSTNGVVYINTDSTGKGWLSASGSHSLQAFVNDLLRDLQDPKRGVSLFQAKLDRAISQAKTDDEKRTLRQRKDFPIDALGSGSDYTAFLDFLTVASLNMDFGGDGGGGIYHSAYDSFYWYTHFSDTDFSFSAALSRTMGTALLRLADADVLPFEFTATAHTLREYVSEIDKLRTQSTDAPSLDLTPLLYGDRSPRQGSAGVQRRSRAPLIDGQNVCRCATGRVEPPAVHLRAELQVRRRTPATRMVQASGLRPRVLYRLRRQNAARDPRRAGAEAMGGSAHLRANRREGDRRAGRSGTEGSSRRRGAHPALIRNQSR